MYNVIICVYIVVPPGNIIMLSNYADDDSIETGRYEELEFGRVPLKCQRVVYYYYHGCVLIELYQFFACVLCTNIIWNVISPSLFVLYTLYSNGMWVPIYCIIIRYNNIIKYTCIIYLRAVSTRVIITLLLLYTYTRSCGLAVVCIFNIDYRIPASRVWVHAAV